MAQMRCTSVQTLSVHGCRQSNTTDSIAELCRYAHVFGAKVYVTVNTIIFENELAKADRLIGELVKVELMPFWFGDMAVPELIKKYGNDVPELHASTQTDNRNTEKVKWLHSVGFKRVVLARELSLEEIKHIHAAAPDVELESLCARALCVSYSVRAMHRCTASTEVPTGECAQFCRLKFDLYDDNGKLIEQDRHLLSLKDMSQYDVVEQLMDAWRDFFENRRASEERRLCEERCGSIQSAYR